MQNIEMPNLTKEQQNALDSNNGVVHGVSYVLMRTEVVLDWFGYTQEELHSELQPALDQVANGEVAPWNLEVFLDKMHEQHARKVN